MKQHLNTLFVTTPGAYLARDGETLVVRIENETRLRAPLLNLGAIVTFGSVGCSPALMGACARGDIAISFLSRSGHFLARVSGFTPGNVLLRREQYRQADDERASVAIARNMILGKVANMRNVLIRAARETEDTVDAEMLRRAAVLMTPTLSELNDARDLDHLRGLEGECSSRYFSVFNYLVTVGDDAFVFHGRSRRPPLDNVNALISFLYAMLTLDARAACETAGLDPQVGFLHRDRPGRPSLALDLMEEFRAPLADRVALSLINRRQIHAQGFKQSVTGGVEMDDTTRKTVLTEYQRRKQETITHTFIGERTTVGLLVHLQARLLARYLRGDLDAYPAFVWR